MRFLVLIPAVMCASLQAQPGKAQTDKAAERHTVQSFRLFYELLSLPNDAHYPADIEKNVQWCEQAFAKRGFTTRRLTTPSVPLLLASRSFRNAAKTVLIYLQLDGQPVDPSKWNQESPWKPVLKEQDKQGNWHIIPWEKLHEGYNPDWRIFARSASDAKGPVAAFLAALDALKELNAEPNYNLKVIMDFEEELGSPHLPDAVNQYRKELAADRMIILDGPRHFSNLPTLSFGARGICEMTLTVYGPRRPVHSGNYGNYTPNPAMRLAQLLASMKDADGRVTIPGFYDGVTLTPEEKAILKQVPDDEHAIRNFLGIAQPDKIGENFQESLQYPTLNIRGLNALYVGQEARTLIPNNAVAEIDIRLVPSSHAERLAGLIINHIKQQGYYLTEAEPTEEERAQHPRLASVSYRVSYGPFQTPFDSETGKWLTRALNRAFGKDPVRIRMTGGSIPVSPFVNALNIPAVAVPTVNPDNNQHAENENIRVGNYAEAVKSFLYILLEKL